MARPRGSLTALDDLPESIPVVGVLRNWFTEVPSLTSPIVNRQCDVMRRNGASDRWPTSLDGFHGSTGGGVLEYDP